MRLARQVLLHPLVLVGREVGENVEFAGTVTLQRGFLILKHEELRAVDLDILSTVILVVLDGRDVRTGDPFGRLVRTVGDDVANLDPVLTLGLDDMLRQRIGRVVHQGVDEIGGRVFKGDLERLVVDRLDAELVQIGDLALVDLLCVLDGELQIGVVGRIFRIDEALEGEHKVAGRYRLAIGPLDAITELESVDLAIRGNGPAFGLAGNRVVLGVFGDEAFEDVAGNTVFPVAGEFLRIQRGGVATIMDIQRGRVGRKCEQ